jgi:hypothetical protein
VAADRSPADLPARPGPQAGLAGAGGPVRGNAPLGAQQRRCLPCPCPCRQPGRDLVAGGKGLVTGTAGLAAGDGGAGSGVAGETDGTAIARDCGEEAGVASDVAGVPARSLRPAPGAVLGPPAVPWLGTSSANATAATMSTRAVAEAVRAVRKLVSSSQELMTFRSRARPAGRA